MTETDDTIVAIDVGTQSVRAIAIDPTGTLAGRRRVPIEPYVSPRPGCAEQDPELYWRSIGEATHRLLGRSGDADGRDRRRHAHHPARAPSS